MLPPKDLAIPYVNTSYSETANVGVKIVLSLLDGSINRHSMKIHKATKFDSKNQMIKFVWNNPSAHIWGTFVLKSFILRVSSPQRERISKENSSYLPGYWHLRVSRPRSSEITRCFLYQKYKEKLYFQTTVRESKKEWIYKIGAHQSQPC